MVYGFHHSCIPSPHTFAITTSWCPDENICSSFDINQWETSRECVVSLATCWFVIDPSIFFLLSGARSCWQVFWGQTIHQMCFGSFSRVSNQLDVSVKPRKHPTQKPEQCRLEATSKRLSCSLRLSPATLRTKPILAACICICHLQTSSQDRVGQGLVNDHITAGAAPICLVTLMAWQPFIRMNVGGSFLKLH